MKKLILTLSVVVASYNTIEAKSPSAQKESSSEAEIGVVVEALLERKFSEHIKLIGVSQQSESVVVTANVSGKIDYITAKEGGALFKGEVIMKIDEKIAEARKSQIEAAYSLAEFRFMSYKDLYNAALLNEERFQVVKNEFEQAKLEYVQGLQTYNDMIIKAPEVCTVGIIKKRPGERVVPGDVLFSINQKGGFVVKIDIPERLLQIFINKNLTILVKDTANNKIRANILSFSNQISKHGTFEVRLGVPEDSALVEGSFVEVEIEYNSHQAMSVPEIAICKNNNGDFVYKVVNGVIKRVFVQTKLRSNGYIEIFSDDIKKGDLIVIEGLTKIEDGSKVSIK